MEWNQQEDVRNYIVEAVTPILDNERVIYGLLTEAAATAVRDDMGTGVGREDYERMLAGRGGNGTDRHDYARVVGIAVRDALAEHLKDLADELPEGKANLLYRLLVDVLDLYDSRQRDLLGEHYLPERIDDIDWNEESEDDDE